MKLPKFVTRAFWIINVLVLSIGFCGAAGAQSQQTVKQLQQLIGERAPAFSPRVTSARPRSNHEYGQPAGEQADRVQKRAHGMVPVVGHAAAGGDGAGDGAKDRRRMTFDVSRIGD